MGISFDHSSTYRKLRQAGAAEAPVGAVTEADCGKLIRINSRDEVQIEAPARDRWRNVCCPADALEQLMLQLNAIGATQATREWKIKSVDELQGGKVVCACIGPEGVEEEGYFDNPRFDASMHEYSDERV